MAHDSDIDSWDLRQGDLPAHNFRHNLPRPAAISSYAAGESRYHSPPNGYSYYQHRTRSTRSGSDVRFTNPAIYAVPLEQHRPIIEANCGDSSALVGNISSLSISGASYKPDNAGDQNTGRNTYRCPPLSPPTGSSIVSSRANSKSSVTVRCCTLGKSRTAEEGSNELSDQPEVQRYAVNGQRVVEFSSNSLSSSNLSEHQGSSTGRRNAYEDWVEKKRAADLRRKEEARRIEQEKQAEEERLTKEREEREKRERENFLQWAERKRKEEASKKEALERELEFERRLQEVEEQTVMAKTIHLRQWARKKAEQQKTLQKKQELKEKREDEERKKRLEESSKAYEKWRETSKNRPRPATQGLLPIHKATPSYINPNPWVVDDNELTEESKGPLTVDVKKSTIGQSRSSVRKSIAWKQ